MVKKLRYLARFIVVCLLLKKTKQVRELIKELGKQIDDYVKIYDPEDQLEWQLVRNEINDFIQADQVIAGEISSTLSCRLNLANIPAFIDYSNETHLVLNEVVIIGNSQNQIKFSELSLDMFRMLQAVEREPSNDRLTGSFENMSLEKQKTNAIQDANSPLQRDNPHKYLLYKPSFSQCYTYISAAFKDLPAHSLMLIYISADACESHSKVQIECE